MIRLRRRSRRRQRRPLRRQAAAGSTGRRGPSRRGAPVTARPQGRRHARTACVRSRSAAAAPLSSNSGPATHRERHAEHASAAVDPTIRRGSMAPACRRSSGLRLAPRPGPHGVHGVVRAGHLRVRRAPERPVPHPGHRVQREQAGDAARRRPASRRAGRRRRPRPAAARACRGSRRTAGCPARLSAGTKNSTPSSGEMPGEPAQPVQRRWCRRAARPARRRGTASSG